MLKKRSTGWKRTVKSGASLGMSSAAAACSTDSVSLSVFILIAMRNNCAQEASRGRMHPHPRGT